MIGLRQRLTRGQGSGEETADEAGPSGSGAAGPVGGESSIMATSGGASAIMQVGPFAGASTTAASESGLNIDPDAFYLVLNCTTVIKALQDNAQSIPVYCEIQTPSVLNASMVSNPPATLMPTALQAEVPHIAFVAALPFSGLRDSVLRALPHIDFQDLWRDAVSGGFFIWGRIPWAPQGWEVEESFAQKWWFLLDREVIETANFWRAQRGIPRLRSRHPSLTAGEA